MSEELINRYIDRASIKSDTDFLLSQLAAIDKSYNDVKNSLGALTFSTNSKDVIAGLKAQAEASKQATQAIIDLEKAQQAKLKTEQEAIKVAKEQEKAELERAKTAAQSAKIQTEASKQTATAKLAEAKANTEAAKARDIEAKTAMAYNKENDRTVAAITKEEKALEQLASDYKVLSLAQKDAIARYQNLVLLVGEKNPVAEAAGAEAAALTQQLKNVDEATLVYTRNVGNYGSAFTSAFSKGFGFLRTVANILPGLGLSGIFLAMFEGIKYVVDALGIFNTKLSETEQAQKNLNNALETGSYKDAVKNVYELKENVRLAKEGFLNKTEVLKTYNETLGKTTGKVSTLDEAEMSLVKSGPAYIQMMLLQAAANLALEEAAKKSVEAEKIHIKQRKEFSSITDEFKRSNFSGLGVFNQQQYDKETQAIEYARSKRKAEAVQAEKDAGKEQLSIAEKFQKDAAKIAKDNGFDFFAGKETGKEKKVKDVKDVADAVAELNKELAGLQVKQDLGEIAPKEADIERVKLFAKAFDEIGKRGGTANSPVIQSLQIRLDPIEARVLEQQVTDLMNKTFSPDKIIAPAESTMKQYFEIYKSYAEDEAKLYDEIAQRKLNVLQTQQALEEAALIKSYSQRKISKEEYELGLLSIQQKYSREGLLEAISYAEKSIDILQIGTKAREDAELKLAKLKKELNKEDLDDAKATQQKKLQNLSSALEETRMLTDMSLNDIGAALTISITNQKNELQEIENQRQVQFENDVARINASSDTEQVKADKIKILEAQRAAQKQKLERDQRQLDLQRARFEKAQTIANIILNGALAVVKALPDIPLAIAVGALSAVELGLAIAAPLPKFRHGKNAGNSYEGFGIVNDGGVKEPILREDGTLEMLPNMNAVTYLKRNDIVFPNMEALRNRVAMSQTDRVLSNGILIQQSNSIDLTPLEKKLDGVINAYNSRPVFETHVTEKGIVNISKNGNSQIEYINKYVKGL